MAITRLLALLLLMFAAGCGDDCATLYRSNENGLLVFVGCDGGAETLTPTPVGH